jgi:hypothetical protein
MRSCTGTTGNTARAQFVPPERAADSARTPSNARIGRCAVTRSRSCAGRAPQRGGLALWFRASWTAEMFESTLGAREVSVLSALTHNRRVRVMAAGYLTVATFGLVAAVARWGLASLAPVRW